MKLVQHVEVEPGWPELGFRADGTPIRLADVEKELPPGGDRSGVYFILPADGRTKVYPWKEAGYYEDDAGEPMAPTDGVPMSRDALLGLGWTDEQLWREHAAYFTNSPPAPHPHLEDDPPELKALRRKLFDETTGAMYAGKPRLHGH